MCDVPGMDSSYLDLTTLNDSSNVSVFSEPTTTAVTVTRQLPSLVIPPPTIPTPTVVHRNQTAAAIASSNEANSCITPKKRKIKLLPPEIASLTDNDKDLFNIVNSIDTNPKSRHYGGDVKIAKSVFLPDGSQFELSSLTLDQVRCLVRNLGISNCGSANKLSCLKAIASFFNYQNKLDEFNLNPSTHYARITSSICRAINIVFSDMYIADFLSVNDRKNRQDHETKNTYKMFWIRASDEHNRAMECLVQNNRPIVSVNTINDDDDLGPLGPLGPGVAFYATNADDDDDSFDNDVFSTIINTKDDTYIKEELQLNKLINLQNVMQFDRDAFQKKITNLFKIRKAMIDNMTKSGTHDNNPWNFVEAAMRQYPGFTKISVYYFYMRCEENPGVEGQFITFLDETIKGDTTSLCSPDGLLKSSGNKKREVEEDGMKLLMEQGNKMLELMADSANDRKRMMMETLDNHRKSEQSKQRRAHFLAQVELAKALDDKDELRELLKASKNSNFD
jgi:hypothetical protein